MEKKVINQTVINVQMDNFNITQYSRFASLYLESNAEGTIGGLTPDKRAKKVSAYLNHGDSIFEVGSAAGLDALELQKHGFLVTASDVIDSYVDLLKAKGLNAVKHNITEDDFSSKYDSIYLNAVLVHFNEQQIAEILNKISSALAGSKILFISFLQGSGYERTARSRWFERDFYYYDKKNFTSILKTAQFKVVSEELIDNKWLQFICTSLTS